MDTFRSTTGKKGLGVEFESSGCGCCASSDDYYGDKAIEKLNEHIEELEEYILDARNLIEEIRASKAP